MNELVDNLWADDAVEAVVVGDVRDASGRVLDLRKLLMRRWGWPKAATKLASEWMEEHYGAGDGYVLPISGPARLDLQRKLFESLPPLLGLLMEGVANRAQREVKHAHRLVSSVEVVFVRDTAAGRVRAELADEGLQTSIASVVAGRLGISMDELRGRCDFQRDGGGMVRMTIWVDDGE